MAIVWLYKPPESSHDILSDFTRGISDSPSLLASFVLFVIALTLDVSQYAIAALSWYMYQRTIGRIFMQDNFTNDTPAGDALSAWSTRSGIDFAAHLVNQAQEYGATINDPLSTNDDWVRAARLILSQPDRYGVGRDQVDEFTAAGWSPWYVSAPANWILAAKLAATLAGYVILVLTILLGR